MKENQERAEVGIIRSPRYGGTSSTELNEFLSDDKGWESSDHRQSGGLDADIKHGAKST